MKKWVLCFWLARAALATEPVGFLAFGDTGTGTQAQLTVASAVQRFCNLAAQCQFAALLGDNFYPAGVRSTTDPQWQSKFERPYAPLGIPFYAALGNHDYDGTPQAEVDYTQVSSVWKMPARYYLYSAGAADFFVIDTNAFTTAQANWLQAALAVSTASWKIVYGHHPIFSYGMHGDTTTLVKKLLPLLQGRADLYVSGHDHDKQVLQEGALMMLVTGTGAETRPVSRGKRTLFAKSSLGFSHLEVDDHRLRLRVLDTQGGVEFEKTLTK